MTAVAVQRKRRGQKTDHMRLDIQGLRMVAVLTVFAFHLTGWPKGGFVGVDVFFVISGFLITGNLLRSAEKNGNVSFAGFYKARAWRIVPAATVVLILTYVAAVLVFQSYRANQVGIDALFAFAFLSNWWFAANGTDYFALSDTVSPIQHYWSLSIEEQFYMVWPALIFVIGLVVARRALTHEHRMRFAGIVMATVVVLSLGWSLYETATSPTWAYFNTLSRVWELGVGALLATAVGVLGRIPARVKPFLSWAGLGLIAASLVLITEQAPGFPAPWAVLPVAGAALVIAAGVNGEPGQWLLRHPASVYIGTISYSLYLVHWPVIVILAALTPPSPVFYVAAVALTFALAVASFHLVENPLRYVGRRRPEDDGLPPLRYASLAALTLVVVGLAALTLRPVTAHQVPPAAVPIPVAQQAGVPGPQLGPLGAALQAEIAAALQATAWPQLTPPMEEAISGDLIAPPDVQKCGGTSALPDDQCTWGSASAPLRIVLIGDSIAINYAGPLHQIALNSNGRIQLHVEAMGGCQFSEIPIKNQIPENNAACPGRKQHAVDYVNTHKPNVVIVSNSYGEKVSVEGSAVSPAAWGQSMQQIVGKFRPSVGKVMWLSAPPAAMPGKGIDSCYGLKSSVPADCIFARTRHWDAMAATEQDVAKTMGGVWIDSSPWFCDPQGLCPPFVGSTPVKRDTAHMTQAYAEKIQPVIVETLTAAGVL